MAYLRHEFDYFPSFKMVVNKTRQWLYSYSLQLHNDSSVENEFFVTFEEPNLFDNPWDPLWLKIVATITWFIGFFGSCFIYTFVVYDFKGYTASFRTVINQLVSWCYVWVSIKCPVPRFLSSVRLHILIFRWPRIKVYPEELICFVLGLVPCPSQSVLSI